MGETEPTEWLCCTLEDSLSLSRNTKSISGGGVAWSIGCFESKRRVTYRTIDNVLLRTKNRRAKILGVIT